MNRRNLAGVAAVAFGVTLAGTLAVSQSQPPTQGPAVGETPAWFLQGSFPDPTGRTIVEPGGRVTVPAREGRAGGRGAGTPGTGGRGASGRGAATAATAGIPGCSHSPLCGHRGGTPRGSLQRVPGKQTLGYTFTYPSALPPAPRGVPAAALGSQGTLWVHQRP